MSCRLGIPPPACPPIPKGLNGLDDPDPPEAAPPQGLDDGKAFAKAEAEAPGVVVVEAVAVVVEGLLLVVVVAAAGEAGVVVFFFPMTKKSVDPATVTP